MNPDRYFETVNETAAWLRERGAGTPDVAIVLELLNRRAKLLSLCGIARRLRRLNSELLP